MKLGFGCTQGLAFLGVCFLVTGGQSNAQTGYVNQTSQSMLVKRISIPATTQWSKGHVLSVSDGGKRMYGYFWSTQKGKWQEWFWTKEKGMYTGRTIPVKDAFTPPARPGDTERKQKLEEWTKMYCGYLDGSTVKNGDKKPSSIGSHPVSSVEHRNAMSTDGKVVAGMYTNSPELQDYRLFLWSENKGFVDIDDTFKPNEGIVKGHFDLPSMRLSPDGKTLVFMAHEDHFYVLSLR